MELKELKNLIKGIKAQFLLLMNQSNANQISYMKKEPQERTSLKECPSQCNANKLRLNLMLELSLYQMKYMVIKVLLQTL